MPPLLSCLCWHCICFYFLLGPMLWRNWFKNSISPSQQEGYKDKTKYHLEEKSNNTNEDDYNIFLLSNMNNFDNILYLWIHLSHVYLYMYVNVVSDNNYWKIKFISRRNFKLTRGHFLTNTTFDFFNERWHFLLISQQFTNLQDVF